jgi:MFS family permease
MTSTSPSAGPAAAGPSGDFPPVAVSSTAKNLVLAVLCAAQFIIALDFSILNVALPVIGRDLGIGQSDLQWSVTAFALPSGGFLLLSARIADLYGRRRLFLTGLALFTAASIAATFAWNPAVFFASRALQGLGAAVVAPAGLSLLTTLFPEGPQRNRALSINGVLLSTGFTVGMLVSGVMTDVLGWRSTMALPAVAGGLLLLAAPRVVAADQPRVRRRLDVRGGVTVTAGLLAVIYATSTAAGRGLGSPEVVAALAVGVMLLVVFVLIESRVAEPLLSLRTLRRPDVAFGNLGGLTTFSMMSSTIFLLTLYLQEVLGLSPLRTSLVFGAQGVVLACTGMTVPRSVRRIGARATLVSGLVVQGVCTSALVLLPARNGVWLVLAALLTASVGHMSAVVSYGVNATAGLLDHEQGLATGLVTSAQQLGITIGIPFLSALSSSRVNHERHAGHVFSTALLSGTRLAVAADAAFVLAAAAVIGIGLARSARSRAV